MRFVRIGPHGREQPAVLDDADRLFALSDLAVDIDRHLLSSDGIARVRSALQAGALPELARGEPPRFGPPVARPGKLLAVGLNYRAHARETGASLPPEPVLFMKGSDTVVGPNDPVLIPRGSKKTDYEVELAVLIGREAHYLDTPNDARSTIAGYTIANDVSERAFQLDGNAGQWLKGKSCPTFSPLGPWLLTADEIPDPQSLGIRCWVNGELRQNSTTADMIFTVDHLVWYASQFMILEPGDVIVTGTPSGVALGLPGQPYLRAGDVVELEIDRLGRQRQVFEQG